MLINNRTTEANVKVMIAALIALCNEETQVILRICRIEEISTCLLFFSL